MKSPRRFNRDYYYRDTWLFRLGYASNRKAHPPLPLHTHNQCMEFVYVVKGSQTYRVCDVSYCVPRGHVFFTLPDEPHDTGAYPEEIATTIYYLIIDIAQLPLLGLFQSQEEYGAVSQAWTRIDPRVYLPAQNLEKALAQLMACFNNRDLHFDSRVRNALSEVMLALSLSQHASGSRRHTQIDNSLSYIHAHMEEPIRVSDLPAMEHMSASAYHKVFVQTMGIAPGEYVLKCRMQRAQTLLEETELSVTEIAYRLGFSSSQYFATVFKRFHCQSPTAYRAARQKED